MFCSLPSARSLLRLSLTSCSCGAVSAPSRAPRWWLCPYHVSDLSCLAITAGEDPEQLWLQQELGQQECAAGAHKGAALHLCWRSWGRARPKFVLVLVVCFLPHLNPEISLTSSLMKCMNQIVIREKSSKLILFIFLYILLYHVYTLDLQTDVSCDHTRRISETYWLNFLQRSIFIKLLCLFHNSS